MGHQSIYNKLRAYELTEAGALAMIGNWECESNCESVRVQGDFSSFRTVSKEYVAGIECGKISREQFKNDQKGFGLAQWTYFTRKATLYDYWKTKGGSIGDEGLQVDFAMLELRSDFSGLLSMLQSSSDLYECTKQICYRFENPAIKNVDVRFAAANRIKSEIDLDGGGDPEPAPQPDPQPDPQPMPVDTRLYLRTIDKNCTGFSEVYLLQAALYCRGNDTKPDGVFGSYLDGVVRLFQESCGLAADGIVGPLTWGKLLERGD